MREFKFPLSFEFKIGTLSNDFVCKDAEGDTVAYVRQKMLKLKEDIQVFENESKSTELYRIRADKWIDWSTAYQFTNSADGTNIGKIAREGWASIWKATYNVIDQNEKHQYTIREENGWVKVMDSLLGGIPILSMFTGYLFNPKYMMVDLQGRVVARIVKEPSFFGRRFTVTKEGKFDSDDDDRAVLSLMMLILMERRRG